MVIASESIIPLKNDYDVSKMYPIEQIKKEQSGIIQGTKELEKIEKKLRDIIECFNGIFTYQFSFKLNKYPSPYSQISRALEHISKAIKEAKEVKLKVAEKPEVNR